MSDVGDLLAGRYRLQRHLGSGGMGVVWHAIDERLQRPVAVKQLVAQPELDPERAEEARQRAMREGRIAARLHHPNAIAVHDVTEHDGLPVLVMEYMPSRSLADVLTERGSISPAEAAGIGAQAASALAAAHAAGIVHRDIKPGNILLGEQSTVKITDFGISHAAGDAVVTQTGILAGTPAYLAPEIARGHPPTPSSDTFSLAATLYAAVEGRPPFRDDGENALALLHLVSAGNVPPPQRAGPLMPVLMRMLHDDPDQRLTPAQAYEALRAIAAGDPPTNDALHETPTEAHTQPLAPHSTTSAPGRGHPATRFDAHPLGEDRSHSRAAPGDGSVRPHRRRNRGIRMAAGVVVALLAAVLVSQLGGGEQTSRTPSSGVPPTAPMDLERVASEYYASLPENPGNAWTYLGPGLQAQGQSQYQNFWSTVADLSIISPPRTTGQNTVHIGIELALPDGTKIREVRQLTMTNNNGHPLIHSDTVLHNEHVPPASVPRPPEPPKDDQGKGEKDRKGEDKKDEDN